MKRFIFISIALLCLTQAFAATEESTSGVDRYAIFIGSNKGGKGREQLLYAGSDALNFQKAMSEIGGVNDANSYVLIDPSKESIDETLDTISYKIKNSQSTAKRSEFIFYYSGHSDENALLLGDTPYDYSALKAAITEVPSDIHVVILDSCYSGNFIRTKGGQKRKPFLIDDSSVVTGHAYLSSSSTNEYSQESDEIESSYFTNAMITGLRGAADTSGDNKVTLNELYSYAFNDTLSKTEDSKAGPQHPNFNITLVGSGDLVLSDISNGEAMLSLSKDAKGKFIIRDANGKLISEINKIAGQPIFMALPAAQYSAVIIDEYSTKQGYFNLEKDQIYVLDQNSLSTIKRKTNRVRGSEIEEDLDEDDYEDEDDEILPIDDLVKESSTARGSRRRYTTPEKDMAELISDSNEAQKAAIEEEKIEKEESIAEIFAPHNMSYFHFSFVPGVSFVGGGLDHSLVSLGILGAADTNVHAFQVSGLMNIATKSVDGIQTSGLFNIAGDVNGLQDTGLFNIASSVNGAQVAGLFNVAEDVNGVQVAGLFNVAKEINGAQIGVVNIAEENNGVALGVFNFIGNGMHHIGFAWDSNRMFDTYFQSGTRRLFMTIGTSVDYVTLFNDENDMKDYASIYYAGLGTEFRFGWTSFDFEVLFKNVVYYPDYPKKSEKEEYEKFDYNQYVIPSVRATWNVISGSHLDLNIGASFDIHEYGKNDRAFELTRHRRGIEDEDSTIYPAFFCGFKIK